MTTQLICRKLILNANQRILKITGRSLSQRQRVQLIGILLQLEYDLLNELKPDINDVDIDTSYENIYSDHDVMCYDNPLGF